MIHVAIISHGHEKLLIESQLGGLLNADANIQVWVKDNRPSVELKAYCDINSIAYFDQKAGLGFGENNNFLFDQIRTQQAFQDEDFFIVMNPDVSIQADTLIAFTNKMQTQQIEFATLNLFKDIALTIPDANIRYFPGLTALFKLLKRQSLTVSYDKSRLLSAASVEWASGAFLAFKPRHYAKLHGFSPQYFMYFEDVDLCYRSKKLLGVQLRAYPEFQALHLGAHKNRDLSSRHAYWMLTSFIRFLAYRYCVYALRKTCVASQTPT